MKLKMRGYFWSWSKEKSGRDVPYVTSMLKGVEDVNTFSAGSVLYYIHLFLLLIL